MFGEIGSIHIYIILLCDVVANVLASSVLLCKLFGTDTHTLTHYVDGCIKKHKQHERALVLYPACWPSCDLIGQFNLRICISIGCLCTHSQQHL